MEEYVPKDGEWPADPQEAQPIQKERIWVDGCFDFAHHGHAGAMLQARQLGKELYVGVHSDEDILVNKGPTVMSLAERILAVDACRWATKSIPSAPYNTYLPWITHYGCWYVVHGDDITSDAGGEDTYRFVKAANRFLIVKRTPGISTTDLVGRMLLCTKSHFIKSLKAKLEDKEVKGETKYVEEGQEMLQRIKDYATDETKYVEEGQEMLQRIKDYATDETGLNPGSQVWLWSNNVTSKTGADSSSGTFEELVAGNGPAPGQRVVYVDGGFDLFSSGHIEFLKQVDRLEEHKAYIVAGVHDDEVINKYKGLNYPIMNIFERGLCVLQCKYVHAVVFEAPFSASKSYLEAMPFGKISAVYHGPTSFIPLSYDPYIDAKEMGIFKEAPRHGFQHVNAGEIVQRILKGREAFEERQRRKGQKAIGEEAIKERELLEQQGATKQG